jgi:hypothetical protein
VNDGAGAVAAKPAADRSGPACLAFRGPHSIRVRPASQASIPPSRRRWSRAAFRIHSRRCDPMARPCRDDGCIRKARTEPLLDPEQGFLCMPVVRVQTIRRSASEMRVSMGTTVENPVRDAPPFPAPEKSASVEAVARTRGERCRGGARGVGPTWMARRQRLRRRLIAARRVVFDASARTSRIEKSLGSTLPCPATWSSRPEAAMLAHTR